MWVGLVYSHALVLVGLGWNKYEKAASSSCAVSMEAPRHHVQCPWRHGVMVSDAGERNELTCQLIKVQQLRSLLRVARHPCLVQSVFLSLA